MAQCQQCLVVLQCFPTVDNQFADSGDKIEASTQNKMVGAMHSGNKMLATIDSRHKLVAIIFLASRSHVLSKMAAATMPS